MPVTRKLSDQDKRFLVSDTLLMELLPAYEAARPLADLYQDLVKNVFLTLSGIGKSTLSKNPSGS